MDGSATTAGPSRAPPASTVGNSSHPLAPPPRNAATGASWQPSQLNRRRNNVSAADDGDERQRPTPSRQAPHVRAQDAAAAPRGGDDDDDARKKARAPESYGGSSLQRIEGWFGISGHPVTSASTGGAFVPGSSYVPGRRRASGGDGTGSASRSLSSSPSHSKSKTPSSLPSSMSKSVTTLVLLHPVTHATTLDSIALQYGVEVAVLRRANGLWPGDSIQARREILIPLDKCTRGVPEEFRKGSSGDAVAAQDGSTGGVGQLRALGFKARDAVEGQGGKLFLAGGGDSSVASSVAGDAPSTTATLAPSSLGLNRPGLHRASSNTSFSSSRQTSNSVSGGAAPSAAPRVKLVPSDALSYFPPPADAKSGKGKGRSVDLLESDADATRAAAARADPGESGVDDLLVLARKAREMGSEATSGDEREDVDVTARPELGLDRKAEEEEAMDGDDAEEPWKPNKWTFGASRSAKGAASDRTDDGLSNSAAPAMLPTGAPPRTPGSGNYNGWNDAPEPPLSRTAKGKVAHAYKGRAARAYHGTTGASAIIPGLGAAGNSILEDLTASTLPNSGPASNWARPIAESVPVPSAKAPSATAGGWGKLFSDTLRGRIGLDEAMSRAANEVAATFEAPAPPGPPPGYVGRGSRVGYAATVGRGAQGPRLAQVRREAHVNGSAASSTASASPPPRPSAELASAALGSHGNAQEGYGGNGSRTEPQDVAGELRDLTIADRSGTSARRFDTWADGATQPSGAVTKPRSRAAVRKIDWTASEG